MTFRGVAPIVGALTILVSADVRADEGMWLFTNPPVERLKANYGFEPAAEWLEHLQKSAIRFNNGGSASFVSGDGLVMTNHHVGAEFLEKLSTPEKNLLDTGFYARSRDEELPCPDLEANLLWSVEDVTDRVTGAVTAEMSTADANTARRKMTSTIEDEGEKATGLDCQVVTLYKGERYHLYRYKRFTDVRLVMAPEQDAAYFGGDTDNFEYPRFCLDVTFFRVYEDGAPYTPEHHLDWSEAGSSEGDLVFVVGHPGRTQRLNTIEHLRFLRDIEMPFRMESLWRREVQLQTFSARNTEFARIAQGDLFGVQNSRKAGTGMLAGLQDPAIFDKKMEEEHRLRAAVDANADYKRQWGDAWDRIAEARAKYAEFYERHRVGVRSDLVRIAANLVRLAEELPKPNAERLPEYAESNLDSLYLDLYSPSPIYDDLEIDRIASGLAFVMETFGGDDPYVVKALAGQSPRARAESLVLGTQLKDVALRKALADGGAEAVAASKDPMIQFARELDPESRLWRKKYEDEIEGAERDAYAKIAAAQFAVNGESTYPDATFTLRLAYGPVKAYEQNGQRIAPYTTMAGLYERAAEREGQDGFALTKRWRDSKRKLDLDTPFNFVCTADIIGGNSGSPVVNQAGEVVGLIFDGNIQSLVLDIAYTDNQARAVSVDARAIIEALREVYGAGKLAEEILE
jgi:hypothetical protein